MNKILLADDDVEYCALLSEYLLAENFLVEGVHDGETAIQYALEKEYDLMILDIMMPRLNGLEVLKHLQNKIQIPILMLTARGDDIDRILGLEMGADDYLPRGVAIFAKACFGHPSPSKRQKLNATTNAFGAPAVLRTCHFATPS